MSPLAFFAALAALAALLFALAPRIPGRIPGAILLLTVPGIFAARLHHAGPYPFPLGADLAYAALAPVTGLLLVRPPWRLERAAGRRAQRVLLGLTPLVLFFAAGAILHEVEEVVVVRTADAHEARLWVVDHEGEPWVVTGQATRHGRAMAANPRVALFRNGATSCRIAELHLDRDTIARRLGARHEKYSVQRFAVAIGLWSRDLEGIEDSAAAIRLAACPPDAP